MHRYLISLLLLMPPLLPAATTTPVVHHELEVRLTPAASMIEVKDRLTLPAAVHSFEFLLHPGLKPRISGGSGRLTTADSRPAPSPGQRYRVDFDLPQASLEIVYGGRINNPVTARDGDRSGSLMGTTGHISNQGIFLSGASLWYPQVGGSLVSFSLHTLLPQGWTSVSQGWASKDDSEWRETAPQDDIYLIAAPYHRYRLTTPSAEAQVYLREPDQDLADRYLEATGRYLALYGRLLGPYPYRKFALVENFWESGYGMPSFTLLGPRVIRFPFILHSSYPHEILHNWWGNGVYVDYRSGNWSEGLTSYLADHLIREQQGTGSAYRRESLQRYAAYVHAGEDFPLNQFRGRHGDISQAVGYGKTLMFLHMLRQQLGDPRFVQGLRRFYRENLFRIAAFDDLREALEQVSGQDLSGLFRQWTGRTGAPALQLTGVSTEQHGDGYRVTGELRQIQPDAPFELRIPIYIHTAGESEPTLTMLPMSGRVQPFDIPVKGRPLRISVDPGFDLFRQLADGEIPASLGQMFGARDMTLILPSGASQQEREGYRSLAAAWSRRWPGLDLLWDRDIDHMPADRSVWLFGRQNRFAGRLLEQLRDQAVVIGDNDLMIADHTHPLRQSSFALTARHPGNPDKSLGLLVLDPPEAADGMARKLPHYSKYGYVVFSGDQPTNVLKGEWQTRGSALSLDLNGGDLSARLEIPEHPPLATVVSGDW